MTKIHERVYNYAIYGSYILYALILFGISSYAPAYLEMLKNFIKIYISLILIIKFNPFMRDTKYMSEFDRKIVFSSGIFLLLTTSIISIVEHFLVKTLDKTPLQPLNSFINKL